MTDRRPLNAEMRQWLQDELATWQQQQVITADQATAILGQYETESATKQRMQNVYLITLGGIAALMFAASVLLLVSFNWQVIPAAGKLTIIFGALIGIYAAGAGCWRAGYPRLAEVIFFFAALMYGASIWLIAQVFHMSAHYPDGYFWWAVGVLPLALILDTLPLHALFAVLLAAWFSTEIVGHRHLGAILFGWRLPGVPNVVLLAPFLAAPGIWLAYRGKSLPRLAIYLSLIVGWICLQPVAWHWDGATAYFIAAVGALLLILGESHLPKSKLSIPYRVLGVLLYGGALLPLSFHWYYREWHRVPHVILLTLLIAASTGLVLAAAEFVRFRLLESGQKKQADLVGDIRQRQWLPLSLAAVIAVLTLLPALGGSTQNDDPLWHIIATIAANVAMVAMALWLLWVGLRDDRGQPFIAGILYFLLWMVVRYSDLFGFEAGMLGAAALFAACGVTIGGLAWFWHQRKKVLHA
jgi:uncharacterized membrane protein